MQCSGCGFENPPIMKFCGQCGTPLEAGPAEAASDVDSAADSAERRNLTVMFCDLADATALSERLDPEELRDVVRDYQRVAEEVVQRCGGHVAQFLGDGIMVYFGYPQARGDDARRAVTAGLGIVAAMAKLDVRSADLTLAVRVGIHTGTVVTGEVGTAERREQLALGQTPNVAARLQGLAAPDEVVLSPAVQRLTQGFFTIESLGARAMKGVPEPMEIFRVVAESGAPLEGYPSTFFAVADLEDIADRRWVTVLFCDLVGSTALSARFDPEVLRDVVLRYQKAVGVEVERFGGYIAQHLSTLR